MYFKNKAGKIRSFQISEIALTMIIIVIISSILTTLVTIYIFTHLYFKDYQLLSQLGLPFIAHKEQTEAKVETSKDAAKNSGATPIEMSPPTVTKPDIPLKPDEIKINNQDSIVAIENLKLEGSNLFYEIVRNDNKRAKLQGLSIIVLKVDGNFIPLPQGVIMKDGIPKWNKKGFSYNFRYRKQVEINLPKLASAITEINIYIFDNAGKLLLNFNKAL
jgi:hypothetical protein